MSEIEWQADHAYEPAERSLESLCREKGLPGFDWFDPITPLVLVDEKALKSLNHYLESDLSREHGGVLAGLPYYDAEREVYLLDIQAAIPALESEGSPVSLQFTPQSWDSIAGILEENFPDLLIVGWYHSHPGLGIFMSGTDQASHQAFYNRPWSLALVVDPTTRQAGWFRGPECSPLTAGQVRVYGQIPSDQTGSTAGEASGPTGRHESTGRLASRNLRWLLPAALFGSALLISGLWLVLKQRG